MHHQQVPDPKKRLKEATGKEVIVAVTGHLEPDLEKMKNAEETESCSCSFQHDLEVIYPKVLRYPTETDIFKRFDICGVLGSGGFGTISFLFSNFFLLSNLLSSCFFWVLDEVSAVKYEYLFAATTHLCIEKVTGLKYACKVIDKENLVSDEDRSDVQREVSIMKHLPPHRNIVGLVSAYEDWQKVYLVMEFCEGGELHDRMRNIRFYSEKHAAAILKDIIQAVKVRELLHPWFCSLNSFNSQFLCFFLSY
jgi:Protein kinase domain